MTLGVQLQLLPPATNLLEASNLTTVLEELERCLDVLEPVGDKVEEPGQRVVEEPCQRLVEEPGQRLVEEPCQRLVEEPGQRVVDELGQREVEKPSHGLRIRLLSLTETPVMGKIQDLSYRSATVTRFR